MAARNYIRPVRCNLVVKKNKASLVSNSIKILITREIPSIGPDMLREAGFSVDVWSEPRPMTDEELLLAASGVHALLSLGENRLNAAFLEACSHLEVISQFAAGYDNIDVAAATRLGIPVANTPGAMSAATADVAFGLMLAVARKFFFNHKAILRGDWGHFMPLAHLGQELAGKTLGIFGLGAIGLEMAKRCRGAYDMEIIYCNRTNNPTAEQLIGARRVSFDTLLRESDVLSVHSVLSPETRAVFNADAFSRMKPNAIFINTSRGGVHDEQALLDALRRGIIWGAGLDVTNPEPMAADHPLLEMENVAILPHIGSATVTARQAMSRMAAENIIGYYQRQSIPYLINRDVTPRYRANE